MADGGPGPGPKTDVFQARLRTDLAGTSNTLTLVPYNGNKILINKVNFIVPNAGITVLVTDNLITAAGTDSGAAGAVNTLYYVYVSSAKATFFPGMIKLSATPPTSVNGVKYLGNAGNALNWRFVGWVRLNATPLFESSATNALIVNYYNRRLYSIFANPGYVNDGLQSQYTVTGNWSKANGGVGSQVMFVANGEDAEIIQSHVIHAAVAGVTMSSGPGIDSNPPLKAAMSGILATGSVSASADDSKVLSEGFHTVDLYGASDGTGVFIADMVKMGAAADPHGSLVAVDLYV